MFYIMSLRFYLIVVDIDECQTNTDFCEHICVNTVSSYYCECNEGYELVDDIHCQSKSMK